MSWEEEHQKRVAQFPDSIREAHAHSSNHRAEIETSDQCGCFYCCATFSSGEIKEWVDESQAGVGQTALCPRCGIDSVIGSKSGFPVQSDFLQEMKKYWF